ncbi:hypothetical protein KFY57_26745, partial [Salmonella enterica subsp. enterica serovar Typhimurium]|nr:hypothetical protein [Salmonella enterica subsp. enterica serovar Typhimurium]
NADNLSEKKKLKKQAKIKKSVMVVLVAFGCAVICFVVERSSGLLLRLTSQTTFHCLQLPSLNTNSPDGSNLHHLRRFHSAH